MNYFLIVNVYESVFPKENSIFLYSLFILCFHTPCPIWVFHTLACDLSFQLFGLLPLHSSFIYTLPF